jgi:hypothetical protein
LLANLCGRYLLDYLRRYPEDLLSTHPTILLVSPWIPRNRCLPLIPTVLTEHQDKVRQFLVLFISPVVMIYLRIRRSTSRKNSRKKKINRVSGEQENVITVSKNQKKAFTTYQVKLSCHNPNTDKAIDLTMEYLNAER